MLTDLQCRKAKAPDKATKLPDALGLYLYVSTTGAKSWRFKYRFGNRADGKPGKAERKLVFGRYPEMSLEEARRERDGARKLLSQGIDPGVRQKQRAAVLAATAANNFEAIAREWHCKKAKRLNDRYGRQVLERFQNDVFPQIGALPISEITAPLVLQVIRQIEKRGAIEMAHRVRGHMSDVFVYAIATGRAETDPAAIIRKALEAGNPALRPARLKIAEARKVLKVTESVENVSWATLLASRLMALTAARPGVARLAERHEFEDLDGPNPIWRIAAAKMKLTRERKRDASFEFVVPLSRQAVDVAKTAIATSAHLTYLFPSPRKPSIAITNNAISLLYREHGFRGVHVPHGWRSSFSTIMNEQAAIAGRETDRPIIDMMLAHVPEGVEAVYNRASYMPRRREIAQAWADMLMEGLPPAASLLP